MDANTVNFFVDQVWIRVSQALGNTICEVSAKDGTCGAFDPCLHTSHHAAKAKGEAGYVKDKWVLEGAPTWRWEVDVSKVDDTCVWQACHFQGFGDIWEDSSMQIGQPAL